MHNFTIQPADSKARKGRNHSVQNGDGNAAYNCGKKEIHIFVAVEGKNKCVEIPVFLEQFLRKPIYQARNNAARKSCKNRSGKNVQKGQVHALLEIFLFADKKPCNKNNRERGERVQEDKISFSDEDFKLYAGKGNEQKIFGKSGNRPEQKQGGSHKNGVEEKRRF